MIRRLRLAIAKLLLALARLITPKALTMDEAITDLAENLPKKMKPSVVDAVTKVTNSTTVQKVGVLQGYIDPENTPLPSTDHPVDYELKVSDPFEEEISKAIIDALKSEEPAKKEAVEEE